MPPPSGSRKYSQPNNSTPTSRVHSHESFTSGRYRIPMASRPPASSPRSSWGKLRQLGSQFKRQSEQQSQQRGQEWTTVLTAPQREKLRAEVERVYRLCYDDPPPSRDRGRRRRPRRRPRRPPCHSIPSRQRSIFRSTSGWDNRPSANNWECSAAEQKRLAEIGSKWCADFHDLMRKTQKRGQQLSTDHVVRVATGAYKETSPDASRPCSARKRWPP